jgi:hypothetical protein
MYANTIGGGSVGPGMRITSVSGSKPTTYALQTTDTNPSSGPISSKSLPTIASITNPPSATSTPLSSKSGSSTGAIAGIAVGVVVGSVALLALGVMLWRTKRKVDSLQSQIAPEHIDGYMSPQGIFAAPPTQRGDDYTAAPPNRKGDVYTHEMQSAGLVELEPERSPQELAGTMIARTNN